MEGFAADWALPHMERIIARDFTGITENMVSLEKAFLTAFGDPDAKRAAQRKLQELVQTGTIHEYTTEFRTLVAELDLSNDGLMMDYEKGLHWRVKEALAMREVIPTTYVRNSLQLLPGTTMPVEKMMPGDPSAVPNKPLNDRPNRAPLLSPLVPQ